MHHEQEVQLIAYHIWEEQGHPHGHDLEHWLKAEAVCQDKQGHAAPALQHAAVPHKAASAVQVKDARTQPRPLAR
jgi:CHAD domain-containing protein